MVTHGDPPGIFCGGTGVVKKRLLKWARPGVVLILSVDGGLTTTIVHMHGCRDSI